jgi:hypothetical protein
MEMRQFSWINMYENYKDILSGSDFKELYHKLKCSFTNEELLLSDRRYSK